MLEKNSTALDTMTMIERYKHTHRWLLIPLTMVILGFLPSYWMRFEEAPWRQHLHGLTATLWFVLLVTQPYLIAGGRTQSHRLFGMLALIVAGGVVISALGAIPYNFVNERMPDEAKYGLSFVDIVLVPGFAAAVIMAIKNGRNVDDHARWMISSVFWAVSPALFRLLMLPIFLLTGLGPDLVAPLALAAAGAANILILVILMWRDRRAHPAFVTAALGSLVLFTPVFVGNMQWWRNIADSLFTV